jgi:hypothetical protein
MSRYWCNATLHVRSLNLKNPEKFHHNAPGYTVPRVHRTAPLVVQSARLIPRTPYKLLRETSGVISRTLHKHLRNGAGWYWELMDRNFLTLTTRH